MVFAFLFGIGACLVSSIPTFSFKRVAIPRQRFLVTMLIVALVIALLASVPWLCLTAILVLYLSSFPFSIRSYQRYETGEEVDDGIDDGLDEDIDEHT